MRQFYLMALISVIYVTSIQAQRTEELYMPREYKQAHKNQTRTHQGIPGKNYFQNKADYVIRAEFFPETAQLTGTEAITYYNNSPHSLSWIYINLYQNRFKKGEARDAYVDAKNIHDGVTIKSLQINNQEIDPKKFNFYSTLLALPLSDKILPNSTTEIRIEWAQQMPVTGLFRIGTYNQDNFFIAYWYPKISVYDDIVGWNAFGHTGNAEFYHDYGDFDVTVTVPSDYNVWSSGTLQNPQDIFREIYLERINRASNTDSIIPIITKKDRIEGNITKNGEKHTWKFKAEHMPDFAFAVSNQYLWDATSAKVGANRIPVNAVYNKDALYFQTVAEISKKTIEFYSDTTPAIPYPYPQFTAFQGQKNGMEFPAMINDQDEDSLFDTQFITTHEVAHAYFPFYVGTNEQEYSWMDESLASIIGISALSQMSGLDETLILNSVAEKYKAEAAQLGIDMPPMAGTHSAGDIIYGFMTYTRPITALVLLYDYMGKDQFYRAIRLFATRWEGKHPLPQDLFNTFNEVAQEDLAWFWKPWFFDLGNADVGIGNVEYQTDKTFVHVENIGSFPVPVKMTVFYKDGRETVVKKDMSIWKPNCKSCKIEVEKGDIKEIVINENIPDTDNDNNKKQFK